MICGAITGCKCSSGSIEQLEFDIQGLFINTPFFGHLSLSKGEGEGEGFSENGADANPSP